MKLTQLFLILFIAISINYLNAQQTLPADIDGNGCVNYYDKSVLEGEYGKEGDNLRADFDNNGKVDANDFGILMGSYGSCLPFLAHDKNGDGCVNYFELSLVNTYYGQANEKGDFNGDGIVDASDFGIVVGLMNSCIDNKIYGDVNNDCVVDASDFGIVIGQVGSNNNNTDLNEDGIVNEYDVDIVVAEYGFSCDSICKSRMHGDLNNDNVVDADDFGIVVGKVGTNDSTADINQDGNVNEYDVDIVEAEYGMSCNSGQKSTPSLKSTQLTLKDEVSISPNPVKNVLNIRFKNVPTKYEIFDSYGKLVLSKDLNIIKGDRSLQIEVNSLKPGIHILYLYLKEKPNIKKFIKIK